MIDKITEYVKGSELPPHMIKKFKIDPDSVFKITIEPRDEVKKGEKPNFPFLDDNDFWDGENTPADLSTNVVTYLYDE